MSRIPEHIKSIIKTRDPKITHLNLSNRELNNNDISELEELLQNHPYINSIDLSYNPNITAEGFKILGLIS